MPRQAADPVQRFWANVQKSSEPNGCWLWTGYVRDTGHGSLTVNGRTVPAHRFSWTLHRGPIPARMEVCHDCTPTQDFPACVNPDHLYVGTHADNMRDSWRKALARGDMSRFAWHEKRRASERAHWARGRQAVPA